MNKLSFSVQYKRLLNIKFYSAALNAAQLVITTLKGIEQMSNPSVYKITLIGSIRIELSKFLKQKVNVIVKQYNQCRYIHGEIVTVETQLAKQPRYYYYQITVKTLLWRLNQSIDCRIFHHQNIQNICQTLFQENNLSCYKFKLFRKHPFYSHQTQYKESALNFLNRLFNTCGIFYYDEHLEAENKFILSDGLEGYYFNNYKIPFESSHYFKLHIYKWQYHRRLFSTRNYKIKGLARSNVHTIAPGSVFQLINHPASVMNQDYVVTKIWHNTSDYSNFPALKNKKVNRYQNIIECIPLLKRYPILTNASIPKIYGVQVATVIHPLQKHSFAHNSNGQVKVLFSWDKRKTGSSFIPIKQPLADQYCGIQFFPRAGDTVVVSFEQGNPDKPFILGSLYGRQSLPFDRYSSGIKTHDGHTIHFSNKPNNEKMAISSKLQLNTQVKGKHLIRANNSLIAHVENGAQKITAEDCKVQAYQSVELKSTNGSIKMTPEKITITGLNVLLN